MSCLLCDIFLKNEQYIGLSGFQIVSHILFDLHKSCMELIVLQPHFSYVEAESQNAFTANLNTRT